MKQILLLFTFGVLLQFASVTELQAACDFTSSQDFLVTPSGTHNAAAGFTQIYLLCDADGVILATSTTGNFGPQAYGTYQVHALNYENVSPPTPLPIVGSDVDNFTGGCFSLFSLPSTLTVCGASNTEACENSGQVISIVSAPDYNNGTGFNQAIVIVDTVSGNIAAVSMISSVGSATFTTTTGTGDLQAGGYKAYAVNFQNPETLASLGLIIGNPWTGNFGVACADASAPVVVIVTAPGSCLAGNSILTACENSTEVISIQTSTYNQTAGYHQAVVVVDTVTGLIASVKFTDTNGLAVFTTFTGTGDLNAGFYDVYALNFEDPATLASLGAIIGNPWPISFGAACADTTEPVRAIVTVPGSCLTLLDIEVLSFTGESLSSHDLLTWELIRETDIVSVDLMHAGEELDFKSIYNLPASSIGSVSGQYRYYQPLPGSNYYRLRFVSANSEESFSEIVELNHGVNSLNMVIAPNPGMDGPVNLILSGEFQGGLEISVIDMLGRSIRSLNVQAQGSQQSIELLENASFLSAGMYFVKASNHLQSFPVKRLIIK